MATTSTASTSLTPAQLALSGLESGIDWTSLVNQLVAAERAPETVLNNQKATIQGQNNAYSSISTQLGTLNNAVTQLADPNFFNSRTTSLTDSSVATASADETAALGTYTFNISQLASTASQLGTSNTANKLNSTSDVSSLVLSSAGFSSPITAGTFSVDGHQITIATSDTLQSVFDQINTATGGIVSGSYDPTSDTISLKSSDHSPIVLGSATDSSNFLQDAQLYNNGGSTVTSTSALGSVQLGGSANQANLATPLTDGGSGAGAFVINGVTINFNATNDSVSDILQRINNSAAGVTASYDTINDQFVLTNRNTGDVGVSLKDVTGNFLAATGLLGGTLQRGTNLQYSINGGGTLTSQSNTITATSSGITGLTLNALAKGSTTVSVSSDVSTIQSAIQNFVTQYNAAVNYISSQTTSTTDSSGNVTANTLTGDMDAEGIQTQLQQLANGLPSGLSGTIQNLNSLGIVSNGQDATLALSSTSTLTAALTNNLAAVQQLFTDPTSGIATTLGSYITSITGTNGLIATKQSNFSSETSDITTTISSMETKIQDDQTRLTNEFVQMETVEAQTNQEKAYLTQAFSGSAIGTGTTGSTSSGATA